MDLKQLNPWNWVKHEQQPHLEKESDQLPASSDSPVSRNPIAQLHKDIDQLFREAFTGFDVPSSSMWEKPSLIEHKEFLRPDVNISSDKDGYTISMEVPGVDEKDVELELSNDTLIIKGEKRKEVDESDKEFHRVERSYGSFQRLLSLPKDVVQDDINATFNNGVLTVSIPRKTLPKAEVKHINIKRAG